MLKKNHEESKSSQRDTDTASSTKEFPTMKVKRGKTFFFVSSIFSTAFFPDAAFDQHNFEFKS